MKRMVRHIGSAVIVLAVVLLITWSLIPEPIAVDVAEVRRARLEVTVDDEARTRVRDRYVITTPLSGTLRRIDLDPGDRVEAGQVLAEILPPFADMLDPRSIQQAEAQVRVARARLSQVRTELQRSESELAYAERDLSRIRRLREDRAATADEVERAELLAQIQREHYAAAQWAVAVAEHELELAEATVRTYAQDDLGEASSQHMRITAPADGRILRVQRESGGFVAAGAELLELGDSDQIEIVAEILSEEAVRVDAGAAVHIERWGGPQTLRGRVRHVEPHAFTEISALGVEEQRVNVIIDLTDTPPGSERLGDGYRVDVRIVTWEDDDVLIVPTGALFRTDGRWAVFVLHEGRAVLRTVEIGRQTALEAQVIDGLDEGDRVVQYPGDRIEDGVRVTPRP